MTSCSLLRFISGPHRREVRSCIPDERLIPVNPKLRLLRQKVASSPFGYGGAAVDRAAPVHAKSLPSMVNAESAFRLHILR